MCIEDKLSKEEVERYKMDLPEEFTAYRCVRWSYGDNLVPLFYQYGEGDSTKLGVHVAGDYHEKRSKIDYKPGFHVFQDREDAGEYKDYLIDARVIPVKIRREWVEEIGDAWYNEQTFGKTLVCSHIKVEV